MESNQLLIRGALFLLLLAAVPSTARPQEQTGAQPEQRGELAMPPEAPSAPDQTAGATASPTEVSGTTRYTIKRADTLWDISNSFLKDPFLWPLIWKLNPYITNPDLIYPGNLLVIPGLAPIERALKAPPVAEKKGAPLPREAAPELPFRGRRPVEAEAPVEEEAPPVSRLILPEEIAPPLIDKYAMLNAGFVDREEGSRDEVVGGLEPKSMFSYDDTVLVKMRSKEEVNIGDKFLVYEPFKRVWHPETGRYFGKLTKVLGILQVMDVESSGIMSGRITLSFDSIERGSLVTPYVEPTLIYPTGEHKSKDIEGYILEVRDGRTINAQADIVYLDKGMLDDIDPGDTFTVYLEPRIKGYPNKVIGEVQVFLVKERTSTAVVTKSTDAMAKGDHIMFKQE